MYMFGEGVCVKCLLCVWNHLPHQGLCIVCAALCVFWDSQRSGGSGWGGNICTQWHRPSAFTHGSCRAALHGLAGCDLPEAPGELFLLKASCASYFPPAKYSSVQLFTWEAESAALFTSSLSYFLESYCAGLRERSTCDTFVVIGLEAAQFRFFRDILF